MLFLDKRRKKKIFASSSQQNTSLGMLLNRNPVASNKNGRERALSACLLKHIMHHEATRTEVTVLSPCRSQPQATIHTRPLSFWYGAKPGSVINSSVPKYGCFWSLFKHNEKMLAAFLITSL